MESFLENYIFFFAAIDPIGTLPLFFALTAGLGRAQKIALALRSCLIAFGILLAFIIAGELVLQSIDIPLSAFQIAGGIILFLFALTMIFGDGKPETEVQTLGRQPQTAIFPLAMPSIASPAAMLAAVMLTEKNRFNLVEQALTTLSMALVILTLAALLVAAATFRNFVGNAVSGVLSRVMGMIIASMAVTHVLQGISDYFQLAGS